MHIVAELKKKIQKANFVSIMFDETTDVSNHEQGSFCVRIVEKDFEIQISKVNQN